MGTIFKRGRFTCPTCHHEFETQVVKAVTHQGQDSDFFPHYLGVNPLPFFLISCPNCSYTAYPEDYPFDGTNSNKVSEAFIKKILKMPITKKIPDDARKFFLAAKIYEESKKNPHHIGNLYLRGSWCCRLKEDRKAEIELQQLAIKFFRDAVDKSTIRNPDNLPVVVYLIGELYRRLEDKKKAREWFGEVEDVVLDPDLYWILELTQKQAELNEYYLN